MSEITIKSDKEMAWCPGCGNFSIIKSVKKAVEMSGLDPKDIVFVSGIGQAAKTPHYLGVNHFDGLHGRSLPASTGIKLANPKLTVINESGDGCSYGEGGNHFLAAIRRNVDITMIVHNNQIYGLTKGQASPTSDEGFVTKTQPDGVAAEPFKPLEVAVALKAGFVARSFSGMGDHVTEMILAGMRHKGFALIDILQPCVTFNKVNNFAWYKKRVYQLPAEYDPSSWDEAIKKAAEWGDKIPIGIIYKNERPSYESSLHVLKNESPVERKFDKKAFKAIVDSYL